MYNYITCAKQKDTRAFTKAFHLKMAQLGRSTPTTSVNISPRTHMQSIHTPQSSQISERVQAC